MHLASSQFALRQTGLMKGLDGKGRLCKAPPVEVSSLGMSKKTLLVYFVA